MQVVLNKCYGGFALSPQARERYAELAGLHLVTRRDYEGALFFHPTKSGHYEDLSTEEREQIIWDARIKRTDPHLVQVVEELGEAAAGKFSELEIVEIPDDVEFWSIQEHDGKEWVAENHRTWS